MKFVMRLIVFWMLAMPAAYIWGMPYLTEYMEGKTREQNFGACKQQIAEQGLQVTTEQGDTYCNCLNDGINFEDGDIIGMAQTKQAPEHVKLQLEAQINICTDQLTKMLSGQPIVPNPAAPAHPQPKATEDGSVEIYL